MSTIPEQMQEALDQHEAELMLLRSILFAMFEQHPNKSLVIARFQGLIAGLTENAPPGTNQEMIVEIRAREQFYLSALASLTKPT